MATVVVLATVLGATGYLGVTLLMGTSEWMIRLTGCGTIPLDGPSQFVLIASSLAFAFGLFRLISMLGRIEHGHVFTRRTIADLRGFTLFVLVSALISILLPLAFAAFDIAHSPRAHPVQLVFDGGDFFGLLVSALLFFVAQLMGEAQRVAEDASQII